MDVMLTPRFVQACGRVLLLLYAGLLVAGCASPGTPQPPSLHLPEVVSDLTADRVGETVRLRWTTPTKTTDGLEVDGAVTAQVCRSAIDAAASCLPVRRVLVRPGPSEIVERLPDAVVRGQEVVLEYRMELLNAAERSAGLSLPVFAAGGAGPPSVAGLEAEPTRAGMLLRWRPEDAKDEVELQRTQLSLITPGKRFVVVGSASQKQTPVHLRADHAGTTKTPFVADAGGVLDTTATRGESYAYTAQRVRRVVLAGHALEMRSAACPLVTVTMRDVFPPQSPTGVEAIAGDVHGVLGIDLSWTPNTEDDLAGYLVYRREENQPGEVRMTPSPVLQPAFRDTGVVPGRTYVYTVKAVDRTGNQSAASAPANETTPPR